MIDHVRTVPSLSDEPALILCAIGFQRLALVTTSCLALIGVGCAGDELPVGLVFETTTSTSSTSTTTTTLASSAPSTAPPVVDSDDLTGAEPTEFADSTTTTIDQSASSPRVEWAGGEGFLLGANLPWYHFGCDFGCGQGARGAAGMSSDTVASAVAAAIEQGSAAGMDVVRWWVFPGEPWQISSGPDGLPVGIEEDVYADLDAALAVADLHDVFYVFTLFSGPIDIPDAWLNTEAGRERLARTLEELFVRYGYHPRIMTWQLVNEPEWQIWNNVVELEAVQDLATKVSAAIHQNSSALSSIGSAHLGGLEYWRDAELDYYTAHWYDPMQMGIECAICGSYAIASADQGIDGPIVIGEYYAGADINVAERLESLYRKGYAGAFAWSLLSDRTHDRLEIDFDGVRRFAEAHADDISP